MKEEHKSIWYPLEEFPDSQYVINKAGEIQNTKTNQILKGTITKEGYLAYLLSIDGKSYRRLAHVLVAKQFIPNPNNYPIVNHIDENKLNPSVDNLEWLTHAENSAHGTAQERSESRRSKPINEYDLNGHYLRTWKSVKEIYLYHNLPYDRSHRPTYLVKILNNNDNPDLPKIVFAESIFIRYSGNTADIDFQIKYTSSLRNDTYRQLKRAENVPPKYLISPKEIERNSAYILQEMIDENQFLFSPSQVSAILYAIDCIHRCQ